MSFCNNNPSKTAGSCKGNPTQGLCERVSIQADKVFDACVHQEAIFDIELALTDVVPDINTLVTPFRFLSGVSVSDDAIISDLTVSPLPDEKCCSRVTCNVTIPVEVLFVDANGTNAVGYSTITIPKDIIMKVPEPSVVGYRLNAVASVTLPSGSFTDDGTVIATGCVTVIMQVLIKVQLLVPSYGYPYIPPCQNYTAEQCAGAFDLPIFPTDCCQDD